MSIEGVSGAGPLSQSIDASPRSFSIAMIEAKEKEINTLMADTLVSMHFFEKQIFNPIADEEADLRSV